MLMITLLLLVVLLLRVPLLAYLLLLLVLLLLVRLVVVLLLLLLVIQMLLIILLLLLLVGVGYLIEAIAWLYVARHDSAMRASSCCRRQVLWHWRQPACSLHGIKLIVVPLQRQPLLLLLHGGRRCHACITTLWPLPVALLSVLLLLVLLPQQLATTQVVVHHLLLLQAVSSLHGVRLIAVPLPMLLLLHGGRRCHACITTLLLLPVALLSVLLLHQQLGATQLVLLLLQAHPCMRSWAMAHVLQACCSCHASSRLHDAWRAWPSRGCKLPLVVWLPLSLLLLWDGRLWHGVPCLLCGSRASGSFRMGVGC